MQGQRVLFVEGQDTSSYDFRVYRAAYPEYLVVPVGGSKEVIKAVTASKTVNPVLGWLVKGYGIVDRDVYGVKHFEDKDYQNVFPLQLVVEIECFLCTKEVFKAVASVERTFVRELWERVRDLLRAVHHRTLEEQVQTYLEESDEPRALQEKIRNWERVEKISWPKTVRDDVIEHCRAQRERFEEQVEEIARNLKSTLKEAHKASEILQLMNLPNEDKRELVGSVAKLLSLSEEEYLEVVCSLLSARRRNRENNKNKRKRHSLESKEGRERKRVSAKNEKKKDKKKEKEKEKEKLKEREEMALEQEEGYPRPAYNRSALDFMARAVRKYLPTLDALQEAVDEFLRDQQIAHDIDVDHLKSDYRESLHTFIEQHGSYAILIEEQGRTILKTSPIPFPPGMVTAQVLPKDAWRLFSELFDLPMSATACLPTLYETLPLVFPSIRLPLEQFLELYRKHGLSGAPSPSHCHGDELIYLSRLSITLRSSTSAAH